MSIEHLADKAKDELPGYKLAGYTELCIPIFKRTLDCLMQSQGQLPVVAEFVLNFCNLNVDKVDIAAILGLEIDLIEQAWWELVYHEFVNPHSGKLTQEGHDYLEEHRLEKKDKALIHVCIDGLIGKIKKDNSNLMKKHDVRQNGLKSIFPIISPPNADTIDFQQVKLVINEYKKIDEEFYEGELIEIVDIKGSMTFYKRLNLLFYSDDLQKNTRIVVFEGLERVEEYENALDLAYIDNNQELMLKKLPNGYPDHNFISLLNFPREEYGPGKIFDTWIDLIDKAKHSITVSLPLIDICVPSDILIDRLTEALKRNVSVDFLTSGYEFESKYHKNQYDQLFSLAKEHTNLQIRQIPLWLNKVIMIDENVGIISDYKETNIYLSNGKVAKTYAEVGYVLSLQEIAECYRYLIEKLNDLSIKDLSNIDKKWLSKKIQNIIGLINIADEKMKIVNGLGWLGESIIPNEQSLRTVPLALKETSFMAFITNLSISITESISVVKPRYLWTGFKTMCPPRLFHVIEKIRTYRNYCDHIVLDEQNRKRFLQYIGEDLAGCLPNFIPNGFLHLQVKLLNELEKEIRNYVQDE